MQWYSTRQLLGIVAFLTFLGGPFFVADPLKPRIGSWPAILITCIPLGLMLFAAYSMVESRVRDRPSRAILWAGIFGMFLTLGEHLYALLNLPRWGENGVFHIVGIPVGLAWSHIFWRQTQRWLSPDDDSSPGDPSSAKPIEPS